MNQSLWFHLGKGQLSVHLNGMTPSAPCLSIGEGGGRGDRDGEYMYIHG